MNDAPPHGPLSDDEIRVLMGLLHRFCEHELDQAEAWRLPTTHGEIYINIRRYPIPGASPEAYDELKTLNQPAGNPHPDHTAGAESQCCGGATSG